ncbi:MAG: sigma-54 dependent transcriptional regulator [Gemmatimonadaceae bacterium]|nr:sigma-54 dependent transcriptional regulator [Gemmatimonadaceae bacterium]
MSRSILVIDDEPGIRAALGQLLEYEGYAVRIAADARAGLAAYEASRADLVFLDVKLPGMDGIAALDALRAKDPTAVVVMISGHATLQTAVTATQKGAYDVLEKPLDTDRVLVLLRNALEKVALAEENAALRGAQAGRGTIVGESYAIRALREQIAKVAATPARVLITGENGTGKELVARAVHRDSPRARGPFVEVNCAAIPAELIESELFGHVKGSFTGAIADRAGKFEQADGGTLFLDEIGDMASAAQAKVLRALQEGEITRIGGTQSIRVDVRVLAATNKRLEDEIAEGRFREDLFYRLNVVPLHVPPLRERRDDVPRLVEHFVRDLSTRDGMAARRFDDGALDALSRLDWPGNVRELRNTVERLLIFATGASVTAADVERLTGRRVADGSGIGALLELPTFEAFKEESERVYLQAKLRQFDWNVAETARALDMPRSNLYKKIEKHGLVRDA